MSCRQGTYNYARNCDAGRDCAPSMYGIDACVVRPPHDSPPWGSLAIKAGRGRPRRLAQAYGPNARTTATTRVPSGCPRPAPPAGDNIMCRLGWPSSSPASTRHPSIRRIRSGVALYAVTFRDRVACLRTAAHATGGPDPDGGQHEARRRIEQPGSGMLTEPCRSVLTESNRWISK